MVEMYGIPNCDTIKKARRCLVEYGIDFTFHNYKKDGVDQLLLSHWVDQLGWEMLLNKRGTTWRKLSEDQKSGIDQGRAIALMCEHPSMIKRPVLIAADHIEVGFSAQRYAEMFG